MPVADDREGWGRLAQAYTVLGRMDEAVEARRRVAALAPDDEDAQLALAEALVNAAEGEVGAEAEAIARRVLSFDPGSAPALWLVGEAASVRGDVLEARAVWTRLLAIVPEGSQTHAYVTSALAKLDAEQESGTPAPQGAP